MKELWKAIIARLVYVLTPKSHVEQVPDLLLMKTDISPMKPGACECTHGRCHHVGGRGKCAVQYEPNSEYNQTDQWQSCACQCFIFDDDGDDGDEDPETPSPSELERMYSK
jgi:hypothetical protein